MKPFFSMVGILLLSFVSAFAEDRITAVRIQGGPPLIDKDGKVMAPEKTVLSEIKGTNFVAFIPHVKTIVPLIGGEKIWWDVPPDAAYVSVVVQWNDQAYTLNSCFPLYKDKATIAVTDVGLVAVSSRRDKIAREERNSEPYKALVHFMDAVLAGKPD
jgi:hypothetical protein